MKHAPIVVGIEETQAAADALRWAAWQSQATEASLVIVHAYDSDTDVTNAVRVTAESVARSWATHWVRDALADSGALPWRTQLVVTDEEAVDALVGRSSEASFLVLGQRDITRAGTPSRVTERCETRARCPVVIVPQGTSLERSTTVSA